MKSLVLIMVFLQSMDMIKAGLHERRLLNDLFMYYDARFGLFHYLSKSFEHNFACLQREASQK